MKKFVSVLCLMLCFVLVFAGCEQGGKADPTEAPEATATPAPTPEPDITEATDYVTEKWVAVEIPFEATQKVKLYSDAIVDVTFTNRSTGTKMVMPAFWNKDLDWAVRFAPTEYGIWDYEVTASGMDLGLNGKKGTLACNNYKGDLEIYKHGFVKATKDVRYFTYDDGTPFFYLGDTHWAMAKEELDSAGKNAADIQTDSHFKYIVDKRVEQGFTVYQSEPIGYTYAITSGIKTTSMKGFATMDRYFQYIAEKGLVHANAELCFPGDDVSKKFVKDKDYLESLTRFWVARYAAYPVLWTLGQEVDDASNQKVDGLGQAYVQMCQIIDRIDPYKHPITAHQLNAASFGAKGGVPVCGADGGYNNYDPKATKKTGVTKPSIFYGVQGHTWWGAQWRPMVDQQFNFGIPEDYWFNGEGKVTINYESRYDYLYTKNFGARVSGWISYLTGMYGYGYGAADIWCYLSTYSFNEEGNDGVDVITTKDKKIPWGEAVLMPTGDQMTYMRGFLEKAGWYKLIPDFDKGEYYSNTDKATYYAAAHDGNDTYVVYMYNRTKNAGGIILQMDDKATYTAQWFDPTTNEYTTVATDIKASEVKSGVTGYRIPEKPQEYDMAFLLTKNK